MFVVVVSFDYITCVCVCVEGYVRVRMYGFAFASVLTFVCICARVRMYVLTDERVFARINIPACKCMCPDACLSTAPAPAAAQMV